MCKIFDTHSHYDDEKFDLIRDEILSDLPAKNVGKIITCGVNKASSYKARELSKKYDYIYFAAGIHPENICDGTDTEFLSELLNDKKCVALGEIGLDYHYEKESAQIQKKIFEDQLIIAKSFSKPVIIHDRDAHKDTLDLILKHRPKGVLHCFSGSLESAKIILDAGLYIGIGGVITFKNSKKLPEIVAEIPLDRILLETDCPYLAPEPFRGRLCTSDMIKYTARKIAEIKNISYEELLKITFENAVKLFLN